jgi:hypothetical protein
MLHAVLPLEINCWSQPMWKVILGFLIVVCVSVGAYLLVFRPDRCEFLGWNRQFGVDADSTIAKLDGLKTKLNISASQVRELDNLLKDYGAKYETSCRDLKAGTISKDEYNCRRDNMDKALDNVRALSVSVDKLGSLTDDAQAQIALQAIASFKDLASSGYAKGCGTMLGVDPKALTFESQVPERSIQVTNRGNRDLQFSVEDLSEAFVPRPSTGTVPHGSMTTVSIIRTILPAADGSFAIKDNSGSAVEVKIEVKQDNQQLYDGLAKDAQQMSGSSIPTLQDALAVVSRNSPDLKDEAGRYLIATGILKQAGNGTAAKAAFDKVTSSDASLALHPGIAQMSRIQLDNKRFDKVLVHPQ